MRNTLFVSILLSLFVYPNLYGQALPESQKKRGGIGFLSIGYQGANPDQFNQTLTSFGYPDVSGTFTSLGGGGYAMIGKFVVGGHGHAATNPKSSYQNFEVGVEMAYSYVDIGYVLLSNHNLDVFPMVGAGTGRMTFEIAHDEWMPFTSLLSNPQTGTRINHNAFLLNVGVTATYLIDLGNDAFKRNGWMMGIQAGWMIDAFDNEWQLNENTITEVPEFGMGGPYIRIILGAGGFNYHEIVD